MAHKKSIKKENISAPLQQIYALLSGIIGGILMLCLCFCLAALSVKRSSLEGERVFILALASSSIPAFITGFVSSNMMKRKGILYGSVSSFLLAVLLLFASLLFTDFNFTYHSIVILLTMILVGTAGGILAVNIIK